MVVFADRLEALRAEMAQQSLFGFIVPRADAYQGEWLPSCDERLAWLTGFTGSGGMAVILPTKAAVFSDGRYTLQMIQETNDTLYECLNSVHVLEWIKKNIQYAKKDESTLLGSKGERVYSIGYDPWLHTPTQIKALEGVVSLVPVKTNPLDTVWMDRPPPPARPIVAFVLGESSADKRAKIAQVIRDKEAKAALITASDSLCWLLNVRGEDVPYAPLVRSYGVLHATGAMDWFVPDLAARGALPSSLDVCVHDLREISSFLQSLEGPILCDSTKTPMALMDLIGCSREEQDLCALPKACKSPAEQAAMRYAHKRDGLALVRFMAEERPATDEMAIIERLDRFRSLDPDYRGPSFPTICGFGPHGAIVHYRATQQTNAALKGDGLLLIDSGGQYACGGTTDITRTLAVGTPTTTQREVYTRVLRGHITLAMARFPESTCGMALDVLARVPLWAEGLNYDHGTGHGVGVYLNVHEGPISISAKNSTQPLCAGMIVSIEPGYYQMGEYGIRLENLACVIPCGPGFLAFEVISLCPFDRTLIVEDMLTASERQWLNAYHARVYTTLSPDLDDFTARWLKDQTKFL